MTTGTIMALARSTVPRRLPSKQLTGKPVTRNQSKNVTASRTNPTLQDTTTVSRDDSIGTELTHCHWPFNAGNTSPLSWWRTMPAQCLHEAERVLLRDTLSKIAVLGGCEWVGAMRGDPAASIAVAVEVMPIANITLQVDLALSAVLLNALDGNAAAVLMLSHVLRHTPLDHPFGKELAVSWMVSNLRGAIKTRKTMARKGGKPKPLVVRDNTALPLDMGAGE
ncbi:hypothetical protein Rpal_1148 [Rhodopseudomonas palustris TIE-1]|nr:hypothetical protein Rpal_1148 [Rhodopseudomonas palustris TIE-1]